ncbi:MAG: hypothetical protein ABEH43_08535 [Flavobacteriales bacterium]
MSLSTEKKINEIIALTKEKYQDERVLDAVLELLKSDKKNIYLLLELLEHKEYLMALNKFMSIREVVNVEKNETVISEEQKKELDQRRARHKYGEGYSYNWKEAKRKIRGKE